MQTLYSFRSSLRMVKSTPFQMSQLASLIDCQLFNDVWQFIYDDFTLIDTQLFNFPMHLSALAIFEKLHIVVRSFECSQPFI